MPAAEVRLEKIGKRYGDQWVVRGVTLHIQRGEFYTFLGPSGCGKTTLLRMIAGFVTPDEGTLFLDGEAVNHMPPWRRGVGMVFQNYALWPHMTVFENVAFGLQRTQGRRGANCSDGSRRRLAQVDLEGTREPPTFATLRRPAATRCAGADASHSTPSAAPRRTAKQSRREIAHRDAPRTPEAAARSWANDDLRHPRPGRSTRHVDAVSR